MRLLLFTDTLCDVNGVARFLRGMVADAAGAGDRRDLHVVTTQLAAELDPRWVHTVPARFEVPIPGYPMLRLAWPRRRKMLDLARAIHPEVIHVSTPGPVGLAGRWVARRLGVPLVGTSHTDFPAYARDIYGDDVLAAAAGELLRWFYRPFHFVLTRSEVSRRHLVDAGHDPARVAAILPGVDSSVFSPARRDPGIWRRLGAPGGTSAVRLLYAGRISREKNLGLLADVWPGVRTAAHRRGIDVELAIVGDGPMLPELRRRLGDSAWFAGFRFGGELAALYATSDLFVFPSTTDTLGQAVLEAQASGLPAVVSARGGPAEIVQDGLTGRVVRSIEPTAWQERIVELLSEAGLRKAMASAARERAAVFTQQGCYESFWKLNAAAIAAARATAPSPSR